MILNRRSRPYFWTGGGSSMSILDCSESVGIRFTVRKIIYFEFCAYSIYQNEQRCVAFRATSCTRYQTLVILQQRPVLSPPDPSPPEANQIWARARTKDGQDLFLGISGEPNSGIDLEFKQR